jgi:Na+-transporting NADH:ubiquinone oxidoreductase subunit C
VKGNRYTFFFATIVCVVASVLLSAIAEGLRSRQELNADMDIKKNILKAVKLAEPLDKKAGLEKILAIYQEKIKEVVVDSQGNIVEGKTLKEAKSVQGLYPLYIYTEDNTVMAYAFPIVGEGLWSTLYGYFAVEQDGITVRGITFYKHGETPGLGGEIEKDWFQSNFVGKTIYSVKDQKATPIAVVKGKVVDIYKGEPDAAAYHVDGITAATITSSGVTALLDKWIRIYDPFFSKIRKKK